VKAKVKPKDWERNDRETGHMKKQRGTGPNMEIMD
jgi:hypothetical protein